MPRWAVNLKNKKSTASLRQERPTGGLECSGDWGALKDSVKRRASTSYLRVLMEPAHKLITTKNSIPLSKLTNLFI